MQERRKATRFPVEARIVLSNLTGITRDVSGLGVLFESALPLSVGESVEFTLALPESVDIRCRGRVVRVRSEGDVFAIGATIEAYRVERGSGDTHHILEQLELHHPNGWEWGE